MGVSKRLILPSDNAQVCGVIFDPIADESIEIFDSCEKNELKSQVDPDSDSATSKFYLGACGLILDYLL
jgi:hypothetical protein